MPTCRTEIRINDDRQVRTLTLDHRHHPSQSLSPCGTASQSSFKVRTVCPAVHEAKTELESRLRDGTTRFTSTSPLIRPHIRSTLLMTNGALPNHPPGYFGKQQCTYQPVRSGISGNPRHFVDRLLTRGTAVIPCQNVYIVSRSRSIVERFSSELIRNTTYV